MLAKLENYNVGVSAEISMQSCDNTRFAAASSSAFHLRNPVSFLFKCVGAVLFSGYILKAMADLLSTVSFDAMKSLTVITAKLENILKKVNHKFGATEYLTYIRGSVALSHYKQLMMLSMRNNKIEVRGYRVVSHFDFKTSQL